MECLIIASYLEAIIPLFYASYILVVVHLPDARYHTEMIGITPENVGATVLPVFVFSFLQIVSIVLLSMLVKRNCGMRALYQLAFVLETQMSPIQGKLMFWMLITLCFRLAHFGTFDHVHALKLAAVDLLGGCFLVLVTYRCRLHIPIHETVILRQWQALESL